jgi:predicted metal-dependent phosphoesterase TrpH
MTPIKIVKRAIEMGLSMIAITDHNSAENVSAVIAAARDKDLYVIPGIEITSAEEAHIIGLFCSIENALSMQEIIFEKLQPGENKEDLFGMQVIADEFDNVDGFNKRLLIGATTIQIEKIVELIHQFNGLAVPAHIDRESYSIISQLGFIPENLNIDAIEISYNLSLQSARNHFQELEKFPFITSSDSHDLGDIGKCQTNLFVEKAEIGELKKALKESDGRKIIYE